MTDFDKEKTGFQHKFIKNDAAMLNRLFGTDDVIPFWLADIDFEIAKPITKELKRLVERGIYAYEFDSNGVYNAISQWFQKRHDLVLNPASFIQVPSVLTGIATLIRELTNPGDGIAIQTPVYHQFARIISSTDREVVRNPLKIVDGHYQMDFEDLENKIKGKNVKAILLCNPHNPVGRVWEKEELEKLILIADKHRIIIISDEIHSDIIFTGHKFNSITSLESKNHIALIGSPGKTFGMQSISNGYIYTGDEIVYKKIHRFVDSMSLGHGNAFTTFATISAFKEAEQWLDQFLVYLENNVSWIESFLKNEMPEIKLYSPEGTYQIWLDFGNFCKSEEALKELLINKAKLGLAPGSWFDQDSPLCMRMNIASPLSKIQNAFERLEFVKD